MQINGPFSIHGAQSIQPATEFSPAEQVEATENPLQPMDEIEISSINMSSEAAMLHSVQDSSAIRMDRVAEIQSQIESGIYETDEKLEVAVGRLLDDLL